MATTNDREVHGYREGDRVTLIRPGYGRDVSLARGTVTRITPSGRITVSVGATTYTYDDKLRLRGEARWGMGPRLYSKAEMPERIAEVMPRIREIAASRAYRVGVEERYKTPSELPARLRDLADTIDAILRGDMDDAL